MKAAVHGSQAEAVVVPKYPIVRPGPSLTALGSQIRLPGNHWLMFALPPTAELLEPRAPFCAGFIYFRWDW